MKLAWRPKSLEMLMTQSPNAYQVQKERHQMEPLGTTVVGKRQGQQNKLWMQLLPLLTWHVASLVLCFFNRLIVTS